MSKVSIEDKEGGPAFPVLCEERDLDTGNQFIRSAKLGMTLRDYFAAKALPALISGTAGVRGGTTFGKSEEGTANSESVSIVAYVIADAMLKARES
jgi:hypothetical protein